MCHLARFRFRCGCNRLMRFACVNGDPGICDKLNLVIMVSYNAIVSPCPDCHDKKWDNLDDKRLAEMDDHQAVSTRSELFSSCAIYLLLPLEITTECPFVRHEATDWNRIS